MIVKNNLSIGGQFKFSVYNKDNSLKYTTDYIDNFITATGLSYLQTYSYADVFRYLSLGSGVVPNTATGSVLTSTGLAIPLTLFSYLGGNNTHSSCFEETNRYHVNGHGYTIGNTGITLFRTWRVPESPEQFITGTYIFREYGLSPGRPAIGGWSNFDPPIDGGVCSCDLTIYQTLDDFDSLVYGRESYDFYSEYPEICTATKMFTRVIKDITVANDEYLTVTYGLTINFNTGISKFQIGVNRNSPIPLSEYYNWVTGSGASNIVHHGIRLINDGTVVKVSSTPQILDYEYRIGTSFNGPLGCPLELSCSDNNIAAYISNDNIQFLANPLSGGKAPFIHLVKPSGLMGFHKNSITEVSSSTAVLGGKVNQSWFATPRSLVTQSFSSAYPDQIDINNETDYSTIAGGTFIPTHIEPTVTSSKFDASLPFTGRQRSRIRTFQFKEPTLSEDLPVRAFVYGYKSDSSVYWFPAIDTLFFQTGIGSQTISPPLDLPTRTYSNPYDKVTSSNSIGHYFMDENNILQLEVRVQLQAPCPIGISGCF